MGILVNFHKTEKNEIDSNIAAAQKELKKEDVFISSTIDDLQQDRDTVKKALLVRGYNPIMSEKNNFPLNAAKLQQVHSHDYCIDQMLECGSLISIIGKSYGGIYAGQKYNKFKQEIINSSNGKITSPSISLMEFYIAVKNGLIHYAFIDKQFDDENIRQQYWDTNIINEHHFINHLKTNDEINDNWISRYDNQEDLSIRIKHLVFSIK